MDNAVDFQTTHKLLFLSRKWSNPSNYENWNEFEVGTCAGQWLATKDKYDILSIENSKPGNGHFEDVLQWFEHSCKRDKRSLRILQVGNKRFADHLVCKRGFTYQSDDNLIKRFK